jgi:hypothetical protein
MRTNPATRYLLALFLAVAGTHSWGQEAWLGAAAQEQLQLVQTDSAALSRSVLFSNYCDRDPDAVWSDTLDPEVRQSVQEYKSGKTLATGQVYGASVKALDLRGKTAAEIDEILLNRGFKRFADVIRDPKTHQPLLDASGRQTPMIVYVHADGGMVRVKPQGDPTSKFRPQPDLSKSVRHPYDADYRDYSREAFKVDSLGRPLPKSPADLKNPYEGTPLKDTFADGWADTVHIDVKVAVPSMSLP